MEEHAGGDGFEFFTGWANGIRSNYGGVYADITHGAILTSRRLEAHNLGREDYRLMDFCRRKLAERPDGKMSLELKQIVSEAGIRRRHVRTGCGTCKTGTACGTAGNTLIRVSRIRRTGFRAL